MVRPADLRSAVRAEARRPFHGLAATRARFALRTPDEGRGVVDHGDEQEQASDLHHHRLVVNQPDVADPLAVRTGDRGIHAQTAEEHKQGRAAINQVQTRIEEPFRLAGSKRPGGPPKSGEQKRVARDRFAWPAVCDPPAFPVLPSILPRRLAGSIGPLRDPFSGGVLSIRWLRVRSPSPSLNTREDGVPEFREPFF